MPGATQPGERSQGRRREAGACQSFPEREQPRSPLGKREKGLRKRLSVHEEALREKD